MYFADQLNHRVRLITPDGSINTVAGTGQPGAGGEGGAASSAMLNAPAGVAIDPAGNLFIADTGNHRIVAVTSFSKVASVSAASFIGPVAASEQIVAAFGTDLGKRMDDVVVITMSEFGRTAKENGSRGTDHGHGNSMFILGNSVKGGKVYADWKGLKPDQLNEGRDLAVTTDFRDVFAEAASKHLGAKDLSKIFPTYSAAKEKFRGYLS